MKLLILGGTVFLGRHLVDVALARGHDVTLFNRGRHHPELFPDVEKLRGDRDGGLDPLRGRHWDAAIDTSGHVPRLAGAAAARLADAVERYAFISTLAVYADFPRVPGLDEAAPLGSLAEPAIETVSPETLGPLKALCEQAVERAMPGRALAVRAGLLVGPHDPTDRFTYWVRRGARGEEILAPSGPHVPVQIIDARDLATWTLDAIDAGRTGAYNVTGPVDPMTLGEVLDACCVNAASDAHITWADDAFLLDAGVKPRMELPLWLPKAPGAATVNCGRARATGLTCRPLADTVRDTHVWDATRSGPLRAGMAPEREAQLLDAWQARHATWTRAAAS